MSRQRAQRLRDHSIKRGISTYRIEVSRRGKRDPLVATSEVVFEPEDRCVVISVR